MNDDDDITYFPASLQKLLAADKFPRVIPRGRTYFTLASGPAQVWKAARRTCIMQQCHMLIYEHFSVGEGWFYHSALSTVDGSSISIMAFH